MFGKRYLRMGIISLLLIMLLGTDSVMSFAVGPGNLLHREITLQDESASEDTLEDGIADESGDQESDETDSAALSDEQIWAQIDKNELRSMVDVESLEALIDETALLAKIDKNELSKKIVNTNLLASLTADEIREEFYELKDSDVLRPYMSIVYYLDDGRRDSEFEHILDDVFEESDEMDDIEDIEDMEDMEDSDIDDIEDYVEDDNEENVDRITENGTVDVSNKKAKHTLIPLSNANNDISISEDGEDIDIVGEDSDSGENGRNVITKVVPVTPADGSLPGSDRLADVVNIQYPIVGENSPFDFIVDPMGLIYETAAAKYGGGLVEQGAGVLFRNTDSVYTFSGKSNLLSIVNKGNVPVKVEIVAKMTYSGSAKIVDDVSLLEGNEASLFFGLVGEEGLLSVFTQEGDTVVDMILDPVPEGTYAYVWNEATHRYDTVMSDAVDESRFDRFKFGVMAQCNSDGDWSGVDTLPTISVTWKTEPIYTEWDLVKSELDEADKPLFVAYKRYKLHELRKEEMERLIGIALDDLISEELDRLIDIEVENLAKERFNELKGLTDDSEEEIIEDDSDETDRRRYEDDEEDLDLEDEDFEEEVDDIEEEEEETDEEDWDEDPYIDEEDDSGSDEDVVIISS